MPDFITWLNDYSVGHTTIDQQHQRIIAIINTLYTYFRENIDSHRDDIPPLLNELAEYAKSHFSFEEDVLQNVGFPGLEDHRKLHVRFVEKTASLNDLAFHGFEGVPHDMFAFLKKWWLHHIRMEDMKYRPLLQMPAG